VLISEGLQSVFHWAVYLVCCLGWIELKKERELD
jgi:hypothetical protein